MPRCQLYRSKTSTFSFKHVLIVKKCPSGAPAPQRAAALISIQEDFQKTIKSITFLNTLLRENVETLHARTQLSNDAY